jgi:hypothetical protein
MDSHGIWELYYINYINYINYYIKSTVVIVLWSGRSGSYDGFKKIIILERTNFI